MLAWHFAQSDMQVRVKRGQNPEEPTRSLDDKMVLIVPDETIVVKGPPSARMWKKGVFGWPDILSALEEQAPLDGGCLCRVWLGGRTDYGGYSNFEMPGQGHYTRIVADCRCIAATEMKCIWSLSHEATVKILLQWGVLCFSDEAFLLPKGDDEIAPEEMEPEELEELAMEKAALEESEARAMAAMQQLQEKTAGKIARDTLQELYLAAWGNQAEYTDKNTKREAVKKARYRQGRCLIKLAYQAHREATGCVL